MNNIINYLIILILTLVSIIGLININIVEKKLKLKGTKIVLFFIILMTYSTLVSFPIKKILNKYISDIKLPKGIKGSRGDRGSGGSSAICDTCGDDLCLKKILFNITNTYNYWRQLNGLKPYSDTYVIKNEYLKDKIIKHCKSSEFQKIIKKYGSNTQNCPENLEEYGCGAYDYMFKMWSIWILIILKYKNGIFFLESDSLTDVDFDGLIEAEDSFLHNDIIIYKNEKYVIDKSKESKRIHPMYHIYQKNNPIYKKIVHISQLELCTENLLDDLSLSLNRTEINSGANSNRLWNQMFSGSNTDSGLKIKRIKRILNNRTSITFSALGINDSFLKTKGLPSRGKLSPFDEIKKYDAWYWGREAKLKPEIIITKPFISEFKKTCPQGSIKFLKTNKYYEIFSTKYKKYRRSPLNGITIDEILGNFASVNNNDIIFLRASRIVMPNEHGYFKEYKPIGDIIITESEKITTSNDSSNCKPDINNYTNVIGKKLTNKETYLVSGDTKSPVDFELVWSYKKNHGINKGFIGLSIWKPIPPNGYVALGYVVDSRYYNGDDSNRPKPNRDSIACVPNLLTTRNSLRFTGNDNVNWDPIISNFFTKSQSPTHSYDISSTKRIFRNTQTNTFTVADDLLTHSDIDIKINETSSIICGGSTEPICNGTSEATCDIEKCIWDDTKQKCKIKQKIPKNNRSSIKDKKYSILKLYD